MDRGSYQGIYIPKLGPVNKIIIIVTVILFLLYSIVGRMGGGVPLNLYLGLSSHMLMKGCIYQLLTYPFIATGLLEVIFGCLIIWFIGSDLETNWGRNRYIKFLMVTVIGAALIFLVISLLFYKKQYPLSGIGGICNALCLAYAILYPDRTFTFMLIFPMKAKYFCAILIAIQLYIGFLTPSGVMAWGHLGAMLSGFLYMFFVSSPWTKNFFTKSKTTSRKKNNLTLLRGEKDDKKDDPPKYWH